MAEFGDQRMATIEENVGTIESVKLQNNFGGEKQLLPRVRARAFRNIAPWCRSRFCLVTSHVAWSVAKYLCTE